MSKCIEAKKTTFQASPKIHYIEQQAQDHLEKNQSNYYCFCSDICLYNKEKEVIGYKTVHNKVCCVSLKMKRKAA